MAERAAACERLRAIGTVVCIPALSEALADPALAHVARHALEALPYVEAGNALRARLGAVRGQGLRALVLSLGLRGEPASVPVLVPFLGASDPGIAAAAATALGRIGGDDALRALTRAWPEAADSVRDAVTDALLRRADAARTEGHDDNADRVYAALLAGLDEAGESAHWVAAWRGRLLCEQPGTTLMRASLSSGHSLREEAALHVLQHAPIQANGPALAGCFPDMRPELRAVIIPILVALDATALPLVRDALLSGAPAVQIAAAKALGEANSLADLPRLIDAAAVAGDPVAAAAEEVLMRLDGESVTALLVAELDTGNVQRQRVVVRLLGRRRESRAATHLVALAEQAGALRLPALRALGELSAPETAACLVAMARQDHATDEERTAACDALRRICRSAQGRRGFMAAATAGADDTTRWAPLFAVLPAVGTDAALDIVAREGLGTADAAVRRKALQALGDWPTPAALPSLRGVADEPASPVECVLALRGMAALAGREADVGKRLQILGELMRRSERVEEKRLALSLLATTPLPGALALCLTCIENEGLVNEAAVAILAIAPALKDAVPGQVRDALAALHRHCRDEGLRERAAALRATLNTTVSFLKAWQVAGPYVKEGVVGALKVFETPFPPEDPEADVEWKPAPIHGDHVSLIGLVGAHDNAAAYLRTRLHVPAAQTARLLMGSDDGIKVWLNGEVVHANNIDRPMVVDEDAATVQLRQGWNDLLLKITQGGGGWSACVKIVAEDGSPLEGLRIDPGPVTR